MKAAPPLGPVARPTKKELNVGRGDPKSIEQRKDLLSAEFLLEFKFPGNE
jgi:hypothetical protein